MDKRIEKIIQMEEYFDAVKSSVDELLPVLERYLVIQDEYKKLTEYYFGEEWLNDYEADERGEIPKDLKRGVLSQDGVYSMYCDNLHIIEIMKKIIRSAE